MSVGRFYQILFSLINSISVKNKIYRYGRVLTFLDDIGNRKPKLILIDEDIVENMENLLRDIKKIVPRVPIIIFQNPESEKEISGLSKRHKILSKEASLNKILKTIEKAIK
ncbi:MAG: hypothetical protein B5M54_11030 [Candidatus Aminicenantes bacterium 4484_214]|nr:MAG: hypothetical protein B5M54_11030 [Candidatus Aminicenantes bacterium 4484_214]